MKKFYVLFSLLAFIQISAQTQIGNNINGQNPFDYLGWSLAISSDGNTVAIGAPQNSEAGYVRVFTNISGSWVQKGADIVGKSSDESIGSSIAISGDGNTIVTGSETNTDNSQNSGYVQVYTFMDNQWTQLGDDIYGESADDRSGKSVAISDDGTVIAVGAHQNGGNGQLSGHVRVFNNSSGVWTQIGSDIDGDSSGDLSGWAVALSNDGTILAVGAPFSDSGGNNSGHVRVFQNIEGNWSQVGGEIVGEAQEDNFGWSVALSSDGNILSIGARYNADNGFRSGHVRIFENVSGVWSQKGQDIDGASNTDLSGSSVDISSNGEIVVIGSPASSDNGPFAGHVRVFQYLNNDWTQLGNTIVGNDEFNEFGYAVSINALGTILSVGAISNSSSGSSSGQVRSFSLDEVLSNDKFDQNTVKIFPNPASTRIVVTVNVNEDYKVVLYNNLGQLVHYSNRSEIDISDFKKGVYFIEVSSVRGSIVKKLIIN